VDAAPVIELRLEGDVELIARKAIEVVVLLLRRAPPY
jgi:hypothetical protein